MEYPLLKRQLPPKIKNVWRSRQLIGLVVGIVVSGGTFWAVKTFEFFQPTYFFWIWLGLTLLFLLSKLIDFALIPYRYQFHRFEIDDADIALQTGYFFRNMTFVPISRIQHVETEQGPLLRKAGLMSVVLHTAATTHRLAGLTVADAQQLREQIIALVKVAKEDV